MGEVRRPPPPGLERTGAPGAPANPGARRRGEGPALHNESEIFDRAGERRGILVFVPDTPLRFAPARGF